MSKLTRALALGSLLACASALALPARAASLQASPILIEMSEKAPTAIIQLRNTGDKPISVQTRVARWTQQDGEESLDETDEMVASPPMATIQPGGSFAVRVVRSARGPVAGEQAYRVLVDQLPEAQGERSGVISLVMRHSIPVFVGGTGGQPQVSWSLGSRNGRMVLRATNAGTRRLRFSAVSVKLADGRTVSFGNGLLGYALAGSTMEWQARVAGGASSGTVKATTDLGPLTAPAHAGR